MARGKEGHTPCKTSSSQNGKMTANYCGHQLAQWAAPAYHKKEDETLHPGACKFSLQYDGRPDGRLGVLVGTWNVSSLCGKGEKIVKN